MIFDKNYNKTDKHTTDGKIIKFLYKKQINEIHHLLID